MNLGNWVFSVMLSTVSAMACYIFDTYQPILIFFVDSKAVVLSTVYICYFSLGRFRVTPVRLQDQCYHRLLPEQWLTHPVTDSFCNNTGRQAYVPAFTGKNAYHFSPLNRTKY